uniref:Diacylglycerol kinase n=1 Tax=mine drainage metagenome TaxID=410659 RepID=E6QU24_9ZZZZ
MQESPYKGKTGVKRVFNALMYSLDGMKAALQYEDAFRQEMLLSVILIPLALYLERNAVERVLMIASVLFVLVVELLNSAVEAAVDRISLEHHHLIKRAKDMGSAAVLISLLNVLVVWGLILLGG